LTDSDDEDLSTPSTPEFINQATAVGFTLDQLCIAEKALASSNVNPCSSDVNLAKSIVSKLVQSKCAGAPWKGPLPPPRTPVMPWKCTLERPCLHTPKNSKLYKIPRHIESCGTCMKY